VTLPKDVRQAYNLQPGQQMTLLDLDGVLMSACSHRSRTRSPNALRLSWRIEARP
jgi:hypothetical protein